MRTIGVEGMRKHVACLLHEHEIDWYDTRRTAYALWEFSEISAPPIRGAVSYAAVLHEIGHILGRHQQSRRVVIRESWAWRWAQATALIWTPAMERSAASAMAWYVARAAKIDRKRAREATVDEQLAETAIGRTNRKE